MTEGKEKSELPDEPKRESPEKPDGRAETSADNGKKGGRPKGSISELTRKKYIMRQILVERVHDEIEPLLNAKFDLATGHFMYISKPDPETGKEVVQRVYKKSPDGKSLEYLLDQVIGKPSQPLELGDPDDIKDIELSESEELGIDYVLKNLRTYQNNRATHGVTTPDSGALPTEKGHAGKAV